MGSGINVSLQDELLNDLTSELSSEPTFNATQLKYKVRNAIREVQRARKYPSYYTGEQIQNDLYAYYSNIRNIALYDYNQIGIEFQNSSSENGVSRSFMDRNKLFSGIVPLGKF